MTYTGYPDHPKNKEDLKTEWLSMFSSWKACNYLEFAVHQVDHLIHQVGNEKLMVSDFFNDYKYAYLIPNIKELDKKTPIKKLKVEYILPVIDFDMIHDLQEFFEYFKMEDDTILKVEREPEDYFFGESNFQHPQPVQDEDDPDLFHITHYTAYGGPNISITWSIRCKAEYRRAEYKVSNLREYPKREPGKRYESYVCETRDHFTTDKYNLEMESIKFVYAWWGRGGTIDLTDDEDANHMYENSSLLEDWCHRQICDLHKVWYTQKHIDQLAYKPTEREITER